MSHSPFASLFRIGAFAAMVGMAGQPALAQFIPEGGSEAAGGSSASAGIKQQSDNVVTDFDGLVIKVNRLIMDPATEGSFRLILAVTDTSDQPRRIAFIQPAAVLLDDVGNSYTATAVSGLHICAHSKAWDLDLNNCVGYGKDDTTKLTPNLPTPVVLTFVPSSNGYSKELADIAAAVSLRARLAYYSVDFKTRNYADIVINGIQLPKRGS